MEKNLLKSEKISTSKILSLISAVFFLIGSVYYSYIHIETAYTSMHTVIHTKLPDGTNETSWEFSLSNINLPTVLSVLLVLVLGVMTVRVFLRILHLSVLLFVFAFKDKLHFLSAALSAGILVLQFAIESYTFFEEYMFARYVFRWTSLWSYYLGYLVKYVPFVAAFLLSAICFALVMISRKRQNAET